MHNHILPAVKCNRTLWLGTSVLKSVNVPTMSAHKLTLAIISVVGAAVLAGFALFNGHVLEMKTGSGALASTDPAAAPPPTDDPPLNLLPENDR